MSTQNREPATEPAQEQTQSATYFFNIRCDDDVILDDDGRELSSVDEAMRVAEELLQGTVRQRVLDGLPGTLVWIEVADANRQIVGMVSSEDVPLTAIASLR
jgi:hypothetical protein